MRKKILLLSILCLSLSAYASLIGSWKGTLSLGPSGSLTILIHIHEDSSAPTGVSAEMDSPDQGATGIPMTVKYCSADSLDVTIEQLQMSYTAGLQNGKLIGTFRQGLMALPLTMEPGTIILNRPQNPVAPFPYTTEEVTFTNPNDGTVLAGTLTLPENFIAGKTPVVVMVTGSGTQNRDEELFGHKPFAVLADRLAREGVASLRYDDRGMPPSGGKTDATTIVLASDAAAAIISLRNRGMKKVGVLGHSEGGLIAFMLAADKKVNPDFIITLGAPALDGKSILLDQFVGRLANLGISAADMEQINNVLGSTLQAIADSDARGDALQAVAKAAYEDALPEKPGFIMQNIYTGLESALPSFCSEWMKYFIACNPEKAVKATSCPALILYGEKDTQVRPSINEPLMRRWQPKADIRVYPSLNHLMQPCITGQADEYSKIETTISEEVLKDISTFANRAGK